jgi:hypothetical protein
MVRRARGLDRLHIEQPCGRWSRGAWLARLVQADLAGVAGSIYGAVSGFPLLVSLTATLTATTPINHRLRLSCKRPLAAPAQQHIRQDPLPRRAGHGHPERLAPPMKAPM